jgi:hypothetical protein
MRINFRKTKKGKLLKSSNKTNTNTNKPHKTHYNMLRMKLNHSQNDGNPNNIHTASTTIQVKRGTSSL